MAIAAPALRMKFCTALDMPRSLGSAEFWATIDMVGMAMPVPRPVRNMIGAMTA